MERLGMIQAFLSSLNDLVPQINKDTANLKAQRNTAIGYCEQLQDQDNKLRKLLATNHINVEDQSQDDTNIQVVQALLEDALDRRLVEPDMNPHLRQLSGLVNASVQESVGLLERNRILLEESGSLTKERDRNARESENKSDRIKTLNEELAASQRRTNRLESEEKKLQKALEAAQTEAKELAQQKSAVEATLQSSQVRNTSLRETLACGLGSKYEQLFRMEQGQSVAGQHDVGLEPAVIASSDAGLISCVDDNIRGSLPVPSAAQSGEQLVDSDGTVIADSSNCCGGHTQLNFENKSLKQRLKQEEDRATTAEQRLNSNRETIQAMSQCGEPGEVIEGLIDIAVNKTELLDKLYDLMQQSDTNAADMALSTREYIDGTVAKKRKREEDERIKGVRALHELAAYSDAIVPDLEKLSKVVQSMKAPSTISGKKTLERAKELADMSRLNGPLTKRVDCLRRLTLEQKATHDDICDKIKNPPAEVSDEDVGTEQQAQVDQWYSQEPSLDASVAEAGHDGMDQDQGQADDYIMGGSDMNA